MKQKERVETLKTINDLSMILDTIKETSDMSLSDVRNLETAMWQLREMVKVAAPKRDDSDAPDHYQPLVLSDAPNAWHYKPNKD